MTNPALHWKGIFYSITNQLTLLQKLHLCFLHEAPLKYRFVSHSSNKSQFINLVKTYKIQNFLALYYSGSILDPYFEKHY